MNMDDACGDFNTFRESNAKFINDIMERYDVSQKDGKLSREECMSLMADLKGKGKGRIPPTEAEVLMVFASCDINHDGLIDADELTKVLVLFMAHLSREKEGGRHWFWWRLWKWTESIFT